MSPAGWNAASSAEGAFPAEPASVHDLVAFYQEHQRRLYALCLSVLGNAADAEDVVQDAFMRVAPLLPRLNGDKGTFLRVVARNLCRDELRRRRFRASGEVPEGVCGSIEERAVDSAELRQVWETLKDTDRSLLAHTFAGYSHSEIAELTGKSAKSINVGIVRARKRARVVAGAASVLGFPAAVWRVARGFGRRAAHSASNLQASAMLSDLQHVGALVTPAAATMVAAVLAGGSPLPATAQQHATPAVLAAARFTDVVTPADAVSASTTVPVDVAPTTPIGQTVIRPAGAGHADGGAGPATAAATAPAPGASSSGPGRSAVPGVQTPQSPTPVGYSGPPPQQVASNAVSPGSNSPQQAVAFNSLTPSPQYQQDGTVYASGTLIDGCYRPSCPVLYRSMDGGAHWSWQPATGFAGGTILMPPSYSATAPTLFAIGQLGLQRSDDGGQSFVPVTPTPVPAAMMPTSPDSDPQVLLATEPLSIYHTASGATTPGPVLPLNLTGIDDVAVGQDGTVFLTAEQLDATSPSGQDGVVVRCPGQSCGVVYSNPNMTAAHLAVSPTFAVDHTLIAHSQQHAISSLDGGSSFTSLDDVVKGAIVAVAYSPAFSSDGHLLLASSTASSGSFVTTLQSSNDGGRSYQPLATEGLDTTTVLNALQLLPGGHVLAALRTDQPAGSYGVRCSTDGGTTWFLEC